MNTGPRLAAISLITFGCVVGPGELEPVSNIVEPEPETSNPPRAPVPRAVGRWAPRNDSLDVCAWRGGEFRLEDFEVLPPSTIDASCASYSLCRWYVDVDAGEPRFTLDRPSRPWPLPFEVPIDSATGSNGRGMALAVDDGWLVAFDHGEWGSAVWWYSADGSTRRLIGDDMLLDFFVVGDLIWAPAAEDFRAAEGYMLRFERGADGWRALSGPELLRAVPQAAALDGDTLLIASLEGVEQVDARGRVTLLAEVDLWYHDQPRVPSSIVRTRAGTILVGSGIGVTRLTPEGEGYREDWLVPPPCREMGGSVPSCTCIGL